ncbi:tyrosine-type recombinase/integrase [Paraburkholderia tropica]|uniref:tyrosine-type recombinase/integrase n=1 Tax=Paraburkholderia tropica TaxID=92647 RepID=UPI002AB0E7A7|nr:site-specific integrase [Paraburkholderia tropica]
MKIIFHSDGIPGYVANGFRFPTLIDSRGYIVVSVYLYMLYKVATNAWTTQDTARSAAQRLLDIYAYFEDNGILFEKVSVRNITEYREYKLKIGIDGKPCAQRTVNATVDAFKDFWRWAESRGYVIEIGPAAVSEYKTRTRGIPALESITLPTADQIKLFLSKMRGPEERIGAALTLGAGLRRAEVVGLPADILLPIEKMERRGGAVLLELDGYHATTKGARYRKVEIPVRLYGEMQNYKISDRRASRIERVQPSCASLLVTKYGLSCRPNWLNDAFCRAAAICGIHMHPHLLRHWYATRFLEYETAVRFSGNGLAALEHLRRLLGHAHVSTTEIYEHLSLVESSEKIRALTEYQGVLDELLRV